MSATQTPARSPIFPNPDAEFEPEWWSQMFWDRQRKIRERVLCVLTQVGRGMTLGEMRMHLNGSWTSEEVRHAIGRLSYNGLIVTHLRTAHPSVAWRNANGKWAIYSLPGVSVPTGKGGARA